jgi:hypothetical protein
MYVGEEGILVGKPREKGPLGRPWQRCDNIKIYFKETVLNSRLKIESGGRHWWMW